MATWTTHRRSWAGTCGQSSCRLTCWSRYSIGSLPNGLVCPHHEHPHMVQEILMNLLCVNPELVDNWSWGTFVAGLNWGVSYRMFIMGRIIPRVSICNTSPTKVSTHILLGIRTSLWVIGTCIVCPHISICSFFLLRLLSRITSR